MKNLHIIIAAVIGLIVGAAVAYPVANHNGFVLGAEWRVQGVKVYRQGANVEKYARREEGLHYAKLQKKSKRGTRKVFLAHAD